VKKTAQTHADSVWALAGILRGTFKKGEYGSVILPFFVLRRIDCALAPTRAQVQTIIDGLGADFHEDSTTMALIASISGFAAWNRSQFDFPTLLADPANVSENLKAYFDGFNPDVREVIDNFGLRETVDKLERNDLLYSVVEKIASLDLTPGNISNIEIGYVFEELLRRFSEMSNETAGEHYTPREVVRLATILTIREDPKINDRCSQVIKIYDPACGTGGMLMIGEETVREHFSGKGGAVVKLFGQEMNEESYATAKADLIIKGQDADSIAFGNTLTGDKFTEATFTYCLANPPHGVSWKQYSVPILDEAKTKGHAGRFGAGTPPVSDGSLLFVQHIVSKLDPEGGRAAIILNSSPLTNGDAGSGESEIRKWLLEQDLLDAIVALPTEMFYNTGIRTYVWLLDNKKPDERKGMVHLIDARGLFSKMERPLGKKRREMLPEHIDLVANLYAGRVDNGLSKIVPASRFKFTRIMVNTPKYTPAGEPQRDRKGHLVFDKTLRDYERVPSGTALSDYMATHVAPYRPDARADEQTAQNGVRFAIEEHFEKFSDIPNVDELRRDLLAAEKRLSKLLAAATGDIDESQRVSTAGTRRMKPSGSHWLGDVPEEWDVMPLKHCISLVRGSVDETSNRVSLDIIESGTGRLLDGERASFSGKGTPFQCGDVLFGKLRPYLAKAHLAVEDGDAFGDIHVYRPGPRVLSEFLFFYVLSGGFVEECNRLARGTKMPRIEWDEIGLFPIALPSLEEQASICMRLREHFAETADVRDEIEYYQSLLKQLPGSLARALVQGA